MSSRAVGLGLMYVKCWPWWHSKGGSNGLGRFGARVDSQPKIFWDWLPWRFCILIIRPWKQSDLKDCFSQNTGTTYDLEKLPSCITPDLLNSWRFLGAIRIKGNLRNCPSNDMPMDPRDAKPRLFMSVEKLEMNWVGWPTDQGKWRVFVSVYLGHSWK